MRIIAIEEHIATAGVIAAWQRLDPVSRDFAVDKSTNADMLARLLDIEDGRIAAMDAAGIDVAVLSHTTPGVHELAASEAVALARDANDSIAEAIRRRPDRFQGFATLPTPDPRAAARELERSVVTLGLSGAMVFGRTDERYLDHADFRPILETAAALRAPIYIHPRTPPVGVRQAYYQGLGEGVESVFATAGLGWHLETGVQALRLILSGVFDRLPELRIILGHWGEVVPFYLERIDINSGAAHLPRPVSDYFQTNFWVTPGGILSQRYLSQMIEIIGSDRIMLASDYPFEAVSGDAMRRFVTEAPISASERAAIAGGTWEKLIADIVR